MVLRPILFRKQVLFGEHPDQAFLRGRRHEAPVGAVDHVSVGVALPGVSVGYNGYGGYYGSVYAPAAYPAYYAPAYPTAYYPTAYYDYGPAYYSGYAYPTAGVYYYSGGHRYYRSHYHPRATHYYNSTYYGH